VRVVGLGGAYTALAEGVEGAAVNAAAPAVREPFSLSWFDLDLDLGVSFPGSYANTDFDNSGAFDRVNNFLYFNVGAQAQLGYFGASISGEFLRYDVSPASASNPALSLTSGRWHALAAYGLAKDQLVVGAGIRAVSMELSQSGGPVPTTGSTILTMIGGAPEIGVLAKPDDFPMRFGATLRAPVSGGNLGSGATRTDSQGITRAGSLILPARIIMPWDIEVGMALQVGPRPLNPAWINPHEQEARVRTSITGARERRARENAQILARVPHEERMAKATELAQQEDAIRVVEDAELDAESRRLLAERKARYANWPRERILLLTSVLMTGLSGSDSVSLEGFLDQRKEPFGHGVTLSPRLGIEAEPIVGLLRSRIGSYLEPSRFDDSPTAKHYTRQHFTFGGDLKLLPWDTFGVTKDQVWRVSFAIDLAPRYIDWGIAFGAWH
jgi:hypothetical protein